MVKTKISGMQTNLSETRSVSVFPCGDNSFLFIFNNDGIETKIRLSSEAVQAMQSVWMELVSRGLAA